MSDTSTQDAQGKLCADVLDELNRCGIDARYEPTKFVTAVTVERGVMGDHLVDFTHWGGSQGCWFGISYRLDDVRRLIDELKHVPSGNSIRARIVFDVISKEVASR